MHDMSDVEKARMERDVITRVVEDLEQFEKILSGREAQPIIPLQLAMSGLSGEKMRRLERKHRHYEETKKKLLKHLNRIAQKHRPEEFKKHMRSR